LGYFAGSVAVITGAGSGIGRALAANLAAHGADLALSDRNAAAVVETARRCRRAGVSVRVDVLDVGHPAAVQAQADAVASHFGRVHLVFCNAGTMVGGRLAEVQPADVDRIVAVNLLGVVHTARAYLPHLVASGGGHLVTVSSAFGLIGVPGYSLYCATKFAVRGFSDALRQELAQDRLPVRVTCAYPGGVRTGIVRNGRYPSGEQHRSAADLFDRRFARIEPEQAAEIILGAVRRGRGSVLVGTDAQAASLFARTAGRAYPAVLNLARRATGSP
jgi:NADP-dependent 3-hydroxy acid dehydrogenase YdfG